MQSVANTADLDYYTRAANDDCFYGGPRTRTKYTYDELNRVTGMNLDGVTQSMGFDAVGRLNSASNALDTFTYGYAPSDATSRVVSVTSAAGPAAAMTYYNTPQDELLKHIAYTTSSGATMAFSYTKYDADDRLVTAGLPGPTTNQSYTYRYDPANRLTSATVGTASTPQYVYTPNAGSDLTTITVNGVTQNYTYSSVNAINSTTTNPTSYDANGSPTVLGGYGYTWDGANRLYTSANPSPTSTSVFTYDGFGQLGRVVERNSSAVVTAEHGYLWCGSTPCLAHDNTQSGSPVSTEYFPQGAIIGGTSYYYLQDRLGSVNALVTKAGVIATQYTFDPYGNRTLISGTVGSDIGYAGYFTHAATGLDFTMHRAFDPVHGRWLNRDPIGEVGGVNLYAYAIGNPITLTDATGLCPPFQSDNALDSGFFSLAQSSTVGLLLGSTIAIPAELGWGDSILGVLGRVSVFLSMLSLSGDTVQQSQFTTTYFHYSTTGPASFVNGLWSGSSATTISGLSATAASQGLGIPPPTLQYPVTVGSGTPVVNGGLVDGTASRVGGLPQVFFPAGTPPGSVGPPTPVPQQ